jgi:EpsI family protein
VVRTAGTPSWAFGASAAALVAVVGAAAALPAIVSGNSAPAPLARSVQPMLSGTWQGPAAVSSQWRPQYEGADRMLLASYRQGARTVDVALVLYDAQSQGEELVNERNQPYDSPRWIRVDEGVEVVTAGTLGPVALTRTSIRSPAGNRLVWSTYIVDGTPTRSGIRVKIESALERLLGRRSGSIAMLVSMPVDHLGQEVRGELQTFVESYLPALIACLRGADSSSSRCVE